jgi:hypothetical protein
MVARQNLIVYQGSDFRRSLEFRDEVNALMDLTGYTFRGQARTSYAAQEVAFHFEFFLRDQAEEMGLVDMQITAEATSLLNIAKETEYLYDIEMVTSIGDVRRMLEGKVKVYPEVTK